MASELFSAYALSLCALFSLWLTQILWPKAGTFLELKAMTRIQHRQTLIWSCEIDQGAVHTQQPQGKLKHVPSPGWSPNSFCLLSGLFTHILYFIGITNIILREADFTAGIKKEGSPNDKSTSSGQDLILPRATQFYTFHNTDFKSHSHNPKKIQNLQNQLPHGITWTYKIQAALLNFQYSTSFEVAPENVQKNRGTCVSTWKLKTKTLPY